MKRCLWMAGFAAALSLAVTLPAHGETYTYDDVGRLTKVVYDDGSRITYTYDNNGNLLSTTAGVNTAPVCNDVNIIAIKNQPKSREPDCSDAEGDSLTSSIVDQPMNGSASIGSLVYTPDADFLGMDSFTYKVNDGFDDSNTATANVTVKPPPTPKPPVVVQMPEIGVNPASHDFGSVVATSSAETTFTISNDGEADLVISSIVTFGNDATQFSVGAGSCPDLSPTIAAGASCTISVTFTPDSPGDKTTILRISSNDADTPDLDAMLTGIGINELIADAGSDQAVDEFITVALDGSGSSTAVGVITSYDWTQLNGPAVALSDTAVAAPTFVAPEVGAAGAVLKFQLTVGNDTGMVSTDEVIVNVLPIITDPEVPPPAMIEMTDGDTDPVEIEATTGAQDVVLMRFEINLDYAVELSSLSLQATGDGDVTTDVSSVSLYADVNENGVVDADDLLIGEGQYAAGGVLELVIDPAYTIESGRRSFIVAYDFNP